MTDPVPVGAVFGALCAGLAVALAPGRRSGAVERRLGSLPARAGPPVGSLMPYAGSPVGGSAERPASAPRASRRGARPAMASTRSHADGRLVAKRRIASWLAGLAVTLVVGGPPGVVLGVGVGLFAARRLAGLEPAAVVATRARLVADLPLAADVMATLLRAGATPERATEATAEAVGGPLGDRLANVVAHLRLGADPVLAWHALAAEPALAPLARALGRTSMTGAALASALERLAEDGRAAASWRTELAARRVGVRAAGPLGLCFLPAFVLIGVVPIVIGIVRSLGFALG